MEDSKVAMLLEHLESQISAIAKGVIMVNEKLDANIEENRRDFKIIFSKFDENRQEHKLMLQ